MPSITADQVNISERFKENTKDHQLTIKLDEGLHRHLLFKKPGSSTYWFEIVTFPGSLVINGDMGTQVFSRLPDMFEFFRGSRGVINPQYWGEKLKASDGETRYSPEVFTRHVNEVVAEWIEDLKDTDVEVTENLITAIDNEVLRDADDEDLARRAVHNFEFESVGTGTRLSFYDTWEWDLRGYTVQFLWNLYAIIYAIDEYDKAKAAQAA